jgi:hypothetical protein
MSTNGITPVRTKKRSIESPTKSEAERWRCMNSLDGAEHGKRLRSLLRILHVTVVEFADREESRESKDPHQDRV